MAIQTVTELPREGRFRIGEPRDLTRRFVLTLTDRTKPSGNEIVAATGVDLGTPHPEYTWNYCTEAEVRENHEDSPFHVLVTAKYGFIALSEQYVPPVQRPPVWSFQTQGATVPALFYYDQAGNASSEPLTNSAFDFFEGLTSDEAQCKVVIRQNLASFPSGLAVQLTNTINSTTYLGGVPHSWKCQGINAELKFEDFQSQIVRFWAVTVELLYRQTGWPLRLPDVGFNFIANNQKRRAMVFDFENAEWVASPGPVGLDGSGGPTLGAPAILVRRVHREVDFNGFFGTPPA